MSPFYSFASKCLEWLYLFSCGIYRKKTVVDFCCTWCYTTQSLAGCSNFDKRYTVIYLFDYSITILIFYYCRRLALVYHRFHSQRTKYFLSLKTPEQVPAHINLQNQFFFSARKQQQWFSDICEFDLLWGRFCYC